VRRGDPAEVVKALDTEDPTLRTVAFAAVGDHHIAAAADKLLALLQSPDPVIRDGAMGALIALREPRAVRPIIELAKFDDLPMMRRIIDAVGAIGGDDAKSYLELVAGGHDVPEIRDLAQQALARIDARAAIARAQQRVHK